MNTNSGLSSFTWLVRRRMTSSTISAPKSWPFTTPFSCIMLRNSSKPRLYPPQLPTKPLPVTPMV
jgi:hypothetical protein